MNKTRTTFISALTRQLDNRLIQNHLSHGQRSKSSAWIHVQTSKHWVTSASQPRCPWGRKGRHSAGTPCNARRPPGAEPLGSSARVRSVTGAGMLHHPFSVSPAFPSSHYPLSPAAWAATLSHPSPFPSLPRCFGNRACLFLSNILRIITSVHRLLVAGWVLPSYPNFRWGHQKRSVGY